MIKTPLKYILNKYVIEPIRGSNNQGKQMSHKNIAQKCWKKCDIKKQSVRRLGNQELPVVGE